MLSTRTTDRIIPNRNILLPGTEQKKISTPKDRNREVSNNTIYAGYGACYRCPCQAFEGSGDVCSNCGHNYHDHF